MYVWSVVHFHLLEEEYPKGDPLIKFYYSLPEQPPLTEARLLFWSPHLYFVLESIWLHLETYSQFLYSTFEDSIDKIKLRAWLWYHVRDHDLHNDMILYTLSINSRAFAWAPPKRLHTNQMYSLFINSGPFPKLIELLPNHLQPYEMRYELKRGIWAFGGFLC